ncbi:MAG: Chromosome partition protein smc [Ktedonobacterales bacterium]|nr:MAG: Chromosome partition protein smc [Ktedonobacterales bacterium]
MYLKRIELHGFKSFAPRTVLEFSPGITAIVGPNGSGKSNIADSIRWVLGEQSMRTLRGKKSDDVIFAGGQSKTAMQMAEVGLVLDNSASWLPSDFTEVTVARRSFRSGDSEYLTNGQRVRLKDVLLLLAQARIGHDSYTVIGQGMVDQALSQRPEERRALFEDAAGIRQFQAQRTDAEQKLGLTQSNLARLRDIVGEIEPRLAPLAEQARRAVEFAGTREELTRLLRIWYRRQWSEMVVARERAEAAEGEFALRIQKLHDALAVEDGLLQELAQRREEISAEVVELRRSRGEATNRLQTTERELAVARERLASSNRQEAELEAEQQQQGEAVEVAQAHVGALEAQIARAEEQNRETAARLEEIEHLTHAARQEQEREDARLRAAQRDVIQAQARLGAAQSEMGRLQKQLGERNRTLAARRDAAGQAAHKLEAAQAQVDERHQAFEAARTAVEALVAQRDDLAREIADGQAEIERLRAEVADSQRESRALADRLALLEEWRRSLEGFDSGVRALLREDMETRPPLIGVLSQLITVATGLEVAVEAALGVFLHSIVVESAADALHAADWLREHGSGHALFIWPGTDVARAERAMQLPEPDGTDLLGRAEEHVSCDAYLQPLVKYLLGDTYVVRDIATAQRMWGRALPPVPSVTRGGEMLYPDGWLRGGGVAGVAGDEGSSALARERELRALPAEIERLAGSITELQAQYDDARRAQEQRKVQSEALRKQTQGSEASAQELARHLTGLQREHERAQRDAALSQAVVEQLAAEVSGIEQEVVATAERVVEQETMQREAAERVEDIQLEVDELLAQGRSKQDELAQMRTAAAVQRQEAKALAQRADQVRAQLKELETQMSRRDSRLASLRVQRDQIAENSEAQEAALSELRTQTQELGERLRARDVEQADIERQIHELERGQGTEREELARLEVEYQRGIIESQRARDALELLARQIREELGTEDEDDPVASILGQGGEDGEVHDAAMLELAPEEATKMRRQIDQLRNRIKHLGGYDPDAPQMYEELKTRYDFLTSQIRDMEQASANLRTVIAELDATMRRQFEETFHAVNEKFQHHFVTLFSGGAARLELTAPRRAQNEDDDEGDIDSRTPAKPSMGGVEVYVQIPGKRVQDLSLLSGGERAMVSVALLFSLLEINPPPFCLLDEVDAALDEANVVRFCEILKVLAERTQFVVITHNRVTMTYASAIYGVSMGENSVSRVISMQLAEVPVSR